MSTILLLLLIVVTVGVIAYFIIQSQSHGTGIDDESPPDLDIRNVREGAAISLSGVGPDADDFDVIVVTRHLYDEDGFTWHELECEKGTEKVWIDIEEDDELEVSITLKTLKLADTGLTPKQLEEIIRKDEGEVHFDGETFEYDDWGDAVFYRRGDRSKGEKLRYWDFENESETKSLSIERWGANEYQVHLSEPLESHQITLYGLGGGESGEG